MKFQFFKQMMSMSAGVGALAGAGYLVARSQEQQKVELQKRHPGAKVEFKWQPVGSMGYWKPEVVPELVKHNNGPKL